jgi:hypothetical protein
MLLDGRRATVRGGIDGTESKTAPVEVLKVGVGSGGGAVQKRCH